MPNKLNNEEYLSRVKNIYGDKYGYYKIEYINSETKICIICKKHGEFYKTPSKFLHQGCPECVGLKRKTFSNFIEMAAKIHGDKYCYNKVSFKSNKEKVIITCNIHGDFEQSPYNHINLKRGCHKCSGKSQSNTEEFIKKSIKIHGDKYNYDKVSYINNEIAVIITCKIHGDFEQIAANHLYGKGCIKCAGVEKSNTEEFIKKSINIHGDKYNYGKVNYINSKIKVLIECKEHGYFQQSPLKHLSGQGCVKCSGSNGEKIIKNILKENGIKYKPEYTFDDLRYKNSLRYDFGILDDNNNLKFILEYNGRQHYFRDSLFHKSDEDFEEYKLRDKLKMEYCSKNNIPLYIIRYDEKIHERLKEIIK